MNNDQKQHMDNALLQVRKMFTATVTYIGNMPVGQRLPASKISGIIGEQFGMNGAKFYTINSLIMDNFPGASIGFGKNDGGFRKFADSIPKHVDEHLEEMMAEVEKAFQFAVDKLDKLKVGDRLSNKELAEQCANLIGKEKQQFYYTLRILLQDYPGIEIKRGRSGGIKLKEEN